MGNVHGTCNRYELDELGLNPIEWELISNALAAYPSVVPYERAAHNSDGSWASYGRIGSVAFDVRRKLGKRVLTTVVDAGYKAGPDLLRLFDRSEGPPEPLPSSETHPSGGPGVAKAVRPGPPLRRTGHTVVAWTSPVPHRNDGLRVMWQMEAACLMAVGL